MDVRKSYRESAVRGASPVELVVKLYEQMIEDLRQAAVAIETKDIESRTQQIKHAILVLGHLQSSLDFTQGGKVALDLDNFYNGIRQGLLQVQFHPSQRGVAQLIADLLAVRGAWIQVERVESPSISLAPAMPESGMTYSPAAQSSESAERPRMDWKG